MCGSTFNNSADIHSYRSDYAMAIYKAYARDIQDIPYDKINRGQETGIKAMFMFVGKMKLERNWISQLC